MLLQMGVLWLLFENRNFVQLLFVLIHIDASNPFNFHIIYESNDVVLTMLTFSRSPIMSIITFLHANAYYM